MGGKLKVKGDVMKGTSGRPEKLGAILTESIATKMEPILKKAQTVKAKL